MGPGAGLRRLSQNITAIKMKRTAAPPMAIPEIAPELRDDEAAAAAAAAEVVAEGDAVVEGAAGGELYAVAVGGEVAEVTTVVGELGPVPSAVRLTYGAQSATGTARGQLGA
jgi:hypothetical protein